MRNNVEVTKALIMQERCAWILFCLMKTYPVESRTALTLFNIALRVGKSEIDILFPEEKEDEEINPQTGEKVPIERRHIECDAPPHHRPVSLRAQR